MSIKAMKPDTVLTHVGRSPEDYHGFVNPPVLNSSTVLFPTLDEYEAAQKPDYTGYTYGRYGSPTSRSLEETIMALEGADHAFVLSSGVAAITGAMMAFLRAGDHVLMTDSAYGPTRRLCNITLARYGVETTYYDPMIGAGIKDLIRPNTKIVYVESPGSLTLEVQDIPAIAEVAHAHGAVVMMDNSWATPLYFKALDKGVDVVIHSATKYINGHSDLVIGIVTCRKAHYEQLKETIHLTGSCLSAQDCYMAQRGLRTMGVRLRHHSATAMKLAEWLKGRPEVTGVLHPAFAESPGHQFWKRDFTGASGLFSILLKPYERTALARMVDNLQLFKMGYSWGGYESLLIPFNPRPIRSATSWEHDGLCLRINAGLEDVDDLITDLKEGLKRLNG